MLNPLMVSLIYQRSRDTYASLCYVEGRGARISELFLHGKTTALSSSGVLHTKNGNDILKSFISQRYNTL